MSATSSDAAVVAETPRPPRSLLGRIWPALLGLVVAIGTAVTMTDGRDAAAVLAASGFVYLAAAVLGSRGAAWPAFWVTFVLIGVGYVLDLNPTPWMISIAVVLFAAAVFRGALRPVWSVPWQAIAMLVAGALALLAIQLQPTAGGLLVAVALLAHAAWDVHHHRTGRVVSRSLAEFCAVLDTILAVLVAVIALTA